MTNFQCKIISPSGPVFEGESNFLVAEAPLGQIGILARHAPLVTPLSAGKVRVDGPNSARRYFKLTSGFLKVENNQAVIYSPDVEESC